MDETALIAMGVLMEEMARESLGETGDMVLVEGEEITDGESSGRTSEIRRRRAGRKRTNTQSSVLPSSGDDLDGVDDGVVKRKRSKKRKLARRAWTMDGDTLFDETL